MRNSIWVRILNVQNLKCERLVHNSAKVVSLQVFGKFSVSPPYACECFTQLGATPDRLRFNDFVRNLPKRPYCATPIVCRKVDHLNVCLQAELGSCWERTGVNLHIEEPTITRTHHSALAGATRSKTYKNNHACRSCSS